MSTPRSLLLVGLGNHGFKTTRHNVGMMAVDALAIHWKLNWGLVSNCHGFIAQGRVEIPLPKVKPPRRKASSLSLSSETQSTVQITEAPPKPEKIEVNVILLKPKLFMNDNGRAVSATVRSYKLKPSDVFALHDDLERDFGVLSWKEKGSANGHNGITSIIERLKTNDFQRLRIGIGRPDSRSGLAVSKYVLGSFEAHELHSFHFEVNGKLITAVNNKLCTLKPSS